MTWAKLHRWLAIVLVGLLVVWSATGLLFHLKPGWDRAYDQLRAERSKVESLDTAIGPLQRKAGELVDANGSKLVLDEAAVRTLVIDAVSRSPHRAAYGDIASVSLTERTAQVKFTSGITVEVGRHDARLSQRGADTDRIDWLYRIHYLQWTGNATFDRAFAVLGLVLIWAVMIPGLVLFVRRLGIRRRGRPVDAG